MARGIGSLTSLRFASHLPKKTKVAIRVSPRNLQAEQLHLLGLVQGVSALPLARHCGRFQLAVLSEILLYRFVDHFLPLQIGRDLLLKQLRFHRVGGHDLLVVRLG